MDALTDSRSVSQTRARGSETIIETLSVYLHGGVDLSVQPQYRKADSHLLDLEKSVLARIPQEAPAFSVEHQGARIKAVVLGRAAPQPPRYVERAGVTYDLSGGRVTGAFDERGNTAEFLYADAGRLQRILYESTDGSRVVAERRGDASILELTGVSGDRLLLGQDPSGRLEAIHVNGEEYARFSYLPGETVVKYAGYEERIAYSPGGR